MTTADAAVIGIIVLYILYSGYDMEFREKPMTHCDTIHAVIETVKNGNAELCWYIQSNREIQTALVHMQYILRQNNCRQLPEDWSIIIYL